MLLQLLWKENLFIK